MVGVAIYTGWYYHHGGGTAIDITFDCSVDEEILHDGVERSNLLYGAKELEVTRVINVHGGFDPWYPAGVHEDDIHSLSPTIFIEGCVLSDFCVKY